MLVGRPEQTRMAGGPSPGTIPAAPDIRSQKNLHPEQAPTHSTPRRAKTGQTWAAPRLRMSSPFKSYALDALWQMWPTRSANPEISREAAKECSPGRRCGLCTFALGQKKNRQAPQGAKEPCSATTPTPSSRPVPTLSSRPQPIIATAMIGEVERPALPCAGCTTPGAPHFSRGLRESLL